MSEDRYKYHCDDYDYIEIIYDTKECEECDSMRMATNLLNRQDQRIADLEAKLAELREQITICNEENSKTFMKSINVMRENAELKQQLAEKKKEIENFKFKLELRAMNLHEINMERVALENQVKNHNQDKIELLEKVNARIKGLAFKPDKCLKKEDCIEDCVEIIDTLIKEIKGE